MVVVQMGNYVLLCLVILFNVLNSWVYFVTGNVLCACYTGS